MKKLDPRTNPFRSEIAASFLKGKVKADRFVDGKKYRISLPIVPLRSEPSIHCSIDTELLIGEEVVEYDRSPDGWSWIQNCSDNYVGWVLTESLKSLTPEPTHWVSALRTFLYPEPELRQPAVGLISMGAKLTVIGEKESRGNKYVILEDGRAVIHNHLSPIGTNPTDYVAIAEQFIGTPYLWGGRTSIGLDCSALVQLAFNACGEFCPRDSDLQENEVGEQRPLSEGLPNVIRGDMVFWKGHVAIATSENTLIHANGHTMTVALESLDLVVSRLAGQPFGSITSVKRPSIGSNFHNLMHRKIDDPVQ